MTTKNATATATTAPTAQQLNWERPSVKALFFEQGDDEGKDVVCDDLVALGGGVGVVALHHAVDAEDTF